MAIVSKLGPPPLNRQPIGLLDFMGIKNGGEYPQELVNRLQPTWDLRDWYCDSQAEAFLTSTAAINATTNASSVAFSAPQAMRPNQGEAWLLSYCSLSATMLGGGASVLQDFALTCVNNSGTISVMLPMDGEAGAFTGLAAATTTQRYRSLLRPFLLMPSDELQARIGGFTYAAPCTLTLTVTARFARFRI